MSQDFFSLSSTMPRGALYLSSPAERDWSPIPVRWADGWNQKDVMGASRWLVLSARALEVVQSLGLTGWEPRAIAPDDSLSEYDLRGHVAMAVHGRCARPRFRPADLITSRRVPAYAGFAVDDWDGSDVFHPEGTSFYLVSSTAYDKLSTVKLTGLLLEPLSSVETFANEVDASEVGDD